MNYYNIDQFPNQLYPYDVQQNTFRPYGFPLTIRKVEKIAEPFSGAYTQAGVEKIILKFENSSEFFDPYSLRIKMDVRFEDTQNANNKYTQQLDTGPDNLIQSFWIEGGIDSQGYIEQIQQYGAVRDILSQVVEKDMYRVWDRHKYKGGPMAHSQQMGGYQTSYAYTSNTIKNVSAGTIPQNQLQCTGYLPYYNNYLALQKKYDLSTQNTDKTLLLQQQVAPTPINGIINTVVPFDTSIAPLSQQIEYFPVQRVDKMMIENSYKYCIEDTGSESDMKYGTNFSFQYDACVGQNEKCYSNEYKQNIMKNGRETSEYLTFQQFELPLYSGLCGQLIPPDQYKLLPMQSFENIRIILLINKFATFTSGYIKKRSPNLTAAGKKLDLTPSGTTDISECSSEYGANAYDQKKRYFKIESIKLIYDEYQFVPEMKQILLGNYSNFKIESQQFTQVSDLQYNRYSELNRSFLLTTPQYDVNYILWWFQSNDYQQYSFCRQHWRSSAKLKTAQIRVGTNKILLPDPKIEGNASNTVQLGPSTDDNHKFIEEIFKTFGHHHNIHHSIQINPNNFALVQRDYDVTKMGEFANAVAMGGTFDYNSANTANPQYYQYKLNNYSTAIGLPFWREQKRGKAFFTIDFQHPYSEIMKGVFKPEITWTLDLSTEIEDEAALEKRHQLRSSQIVSYIFTSMGISVQRT